MNQGSIFRWPLIVGAIFGVVFSLPWLGLINCFCCIGIIACGFVAAMMRSKEAGSVGATFDIAAGTIAGVIAGLVYGVVSGILSSIVSVVAPGSAIWVMELLRGFMENAEGVPPESLDQMDTAIDQLKNAAFSIKGMMFGVVKGVVVGGIFSTIGGLIGGAVFKKEAAAPAAPTEPTPAT